MEDRKLLTKTGVAVDLVLTILFYIFMTNVCMGHVPSESENMQLFFGAFTALPVAGVFWMAAGFLRVTWVDMKQRRAEGKDY